MWRSSLLLAVVAVAGCSFVVGDDSVVGQAPAAPVVELTPEAPTAAVGLQATVPEPAPGIGYTFSWRYFRGDTDTVGTEYTGAVSTDFASTVPVGPLVKNDRWEVTVTPSVVVSGLEGDPGSASVTVVNQPPEVSAVFLSQYAPIDERPLVAIPGGTADADGDSPTLAYEWTRIRDGSSEVIHSSTSPTSTGRGFLDLSDDAFDVVPGDQLMVEVTPNDGDDGVTKTAGPVTVIENVSRWRQTLPQRQGLLGVAALIDPVRSRVLMLNESSPWELAFSSSFLIFNKLPAEGIVEAQFTRAFYDDVNDRAMLLAVAEDPEGGSSSIWRLFEVALGPPGTEVVTELPIGGAEVPDLRFGSAVVYDSNSERFYMFGGMSVEDDTSDDAWALDLSEPGMATWEPVVLTGSPGNFVFSGMVPRPGTDNFFVIGGGFLDTDGSFVGAAETLLEFDPDERVVRSVRNEAGDEVRLPELMVHPAVGLDPVRERIIIASNYGNAEAGFGPVSNAWVLELSDFSFTAIDEPPIDLHAMSGTYIEELDQLIFTTNGEADVIGSLKPVDANFAPMDAGTLEWGQPFEQGVSMPPAISDPQTFGDGDSRFSIIGGAVDVSTVNEHQWNYDLDNNTWTRITVSGLAPRGNVQLASTRHGMVHSIFGGVDPMGLMDSVPYRMVGLFDQPGAWQAHPMTSGADPGPRSGHGIFPLTCQGRAFGYFGGRGSMGILNDTGFLTCNSSMCVWDDAVGPNAKPTERESFALAHEEGSRIVLFGGRGATGSLGDLYTFEPCSADLQPWIEITDIIPDPTHGVPEARHSHRLTYLDQFDSDTTYLLTGGDHASNDLDAWFLIERSPTQYEWSKIDAVGAPERGRKDHAAAWDRVRSRLMLYGGQATGGDFSRSDMWELLFVPEEVTP